MWMILRTLVVGLSLISIAGVVSFGIVFFRDNVDRINLFGSTAPLRHITFESDGVLDRVWLVELIPFPPDASLMGVDIFRIKETLESQGQIKTATVTRRFPDELHVRIEERQPVLKARVSRSQAESGHLLVAGDGMVYEGSRYAEATLSRLPYLGGVTFKRNAAGFRPVSGMSTVARLLNLARIRYPELYADWRLVSCEYFDGDTEALEASIRVMGRSVREIVFAPEKLEWQLNRLNEVMSFSRRRNVSGIRRVDLSLGDQVVVQYFSDVQPKTFRN